MYGITLMAALLAGALSLLTLPKRRYGWVAAVFVIVIGGGWFGRTQSWTAPAGSPISVRLVQANVPQNLKFEPDGIARAFTTHLALMQGRSASIWLRCPSRFFRCRCSTCRRRICRRFATLRNSTGLR